MEMKCLSMLAIRWCSENWKANVFIACLYVYVQFLPPIHYIHAMCKYKVPHFSFYMCGPTHNILRMREGTFIYIYMYFVIQI